MAASLVVIQVMHVCVSPGSAYLVFSASRACHLHIIHGSRRGGIQVMDVRISPSVSNLIFPASRACHDNIVSWIRGPSRLGSWIECSVLPTNIPVTYIGPYRSIGDGGKGPNGWNRRLGWLSWHLWVVGRVIGRGGQQRLSWHLWVVGRVIGRGGQQRLSWRLWVVGRVIGRGGQQRLSWRLWVVGRVIGRGGQQRLSWRLWVVGRVIGRGGLQRLTAGRLGRNGRAGPRLGRRSCTDRLEWLGGGGWGRAWKAKLRRDREEERAEHGPVVVAEEGQGGAVVEAEEGQVLAVEAEGVQVVVEVEAEEGQVLAVEAEEGRASVADSAVPGWGSGQVGVTVAGS